MTEDERERRIQEVENYCDQRLFDPDYRNRWYFPDADFVMRALLEVVECDFYGMERPEIGSGRVWMDDRIRSTLTHFDTLWSER